MKMSAKLLLILQHLNLRIKRTEKVLNKITGMSTGLLRLLLNQCGTNLLMIIKLLTHHQKIKQMPRLQMIKSQKHHLRKKKRMHQNQRLLPNLRQRVLHQRKIRKKRHIKRHGKKNKLDLRKQRRILRIK